MQILSEIAAVRAFLGQLRVARPGARVGFVPTMGALHDGHRSLVERARGQAEIVVASIFVNPTQFGPAEDFSRYPRTLDADCRMLENAGVDLVFTPTAEVMYPPGATTFVEVAGLGDRLDGASRPGHFRGVATVVTKLFHIVQPELAYFGEKDAAQLALLQQMVRDLDFPVEIIPCPTVREPDGLAMSSRNRYLSAEERRQALAVPRALGAARERAESGEHRASALIAEMTRVLAEEPGLRLDYAAVVDPATLLPIEDIRSGALLALAVFSGTTRLIDNLRLPAAGDTRVPA